MMLLAEKRAARVIDSRYLRAFAHSRPIKPGSSRLDRRSVGGRRNGGTDVDCRICSASGDNWMRLAGGDENKFAGKVGGFSYESEHDLAMLVSDFLENGSGGAESWYSSDSDSGIPDYNRFAEKVLNLKNSVDQRESALSSSIESLLMSIYETKPISSVGGQCSGSCIRQELVKLLRHSGYDAAVCTSKWHGSGKVPGGDHEYIDIIFDRKSVLSDRLIIDIDFRSHFEIARAVASYDTILHSLPAIFVGSISKLEKLLQIMVEAAKFSLKQHSMPLPPWRSLPYLQAKWQSEYERKCEILLDSSSEVHRQCIGHLGGLKSSLHLV